MAQSVRNIRIFANYIPKGGRFPLVHRLFFHFNSSKTLDQPALVSQLPSKLLLSLIERHTSSRKNTTHCTCRHPTSTGGERIRRYPQTLYTIPGFLKKNWSLLHFSPKVGSFLSRCNARACLLVNS